MYVEAKMGLIDLENPTVSRITAVVTLVIFFAISIPALTTPKYEIFFTGNPEGSELNHGMTRMPLHAAVIINCVGAPGCCWRCGFVDRCGL